MRLLNKKNILYKDVIYCMFENEKLQKADSDSDAEDK